MIATNPYIGLRVEVVNPGGFGFGLCGAIHRVIVMPSRGIRVVVRLDSGIDREYRLTEIRPIGAAQ